MRSNVLVKMVLLAGLLILLAIALLSISGVIGERKNYRDQVIAEVARSSAREQSLVGPMLVIPYTELVRAEPGGTGTPAQARVRSERVLLPESLFVASSVRVEVRHRGIHRAQVFRASNQLSAIFRIPPNAGVEDATGLASDGPSSLTFGVSDSRGLHRPPVVQWDGKNLEPQPGSGQPWIAQGFSCDVGDLIAAQGRRVRVDIDLELIGTNQLSFVPVGASTRVQMNADWPDPSFVGTFLPDTRSIDGKGFRAGWELSRFATDVSGEIERLRQAARQTDSSRPGTTDELSNFGVRFMEQVDVYQKSERAVKYGGLFVLLTFVIFFVFEVLLRMDLHPMQYLLAGSGVTVFFLLLLSLSEQIPFALAYLVASGACVALLAFYVSNVLRSALRGLWFGLILGLLYGLL